MSEDFSVESLASQASRIAESIETIVDFDHLRSLEEFLKENRQFFSGKSLKCILFEVHESEVFILAKKWVFYEFYVVNSPINKAFYNAIDRKSMLKFCSELPQVDKPIYYFSNFQIYESYLSIIDPLSVIITLRESFINTNEIIEFGVPCQRFLVFCRVSHLKENHISVFNLLQEELACESFYTEIYFAKHTIIDIKEIKGQEKWFIDENGTLYKLMNSIFKNLLEISQMIQETESLDFLLNQLHYELQTKNKMQIIPLFIKYMNLSYTTYIQTALVAFNDRNKKFFDKFLNIFLICEYGFSNLLFDCLINENISSLIITCFFELVNDDSENFKAYTRSKSVIYAINQFTHSTFFEFVKSAMETHFENLLSNDRISEGFKQLNTFNINACSIGEAKERLTCILQNQAIETDDYEIGQVSENEFEILPKKETIFQQLKALIPQQLIIVPSNFRFLGKTVIGGVIVIKRYLTRIEKKVQKARLIVILTHEISHNKRIIFTNKNGFCLITM